MWVSRKEFEALKGRVLALEQDMVQAEQLYLPGEYDHPKVKKVLRLILEHLGLVVFVRPPGVVLAKKGGPKRG